MKICFNYNRRSEKIDRAIADNCGGFYYVQGRSLMKMLKEEELNKLCEGLERVERKDGIKKIIDRGYSKDKATEYYNLWRKHYVSTLYHIN